MIPKTIYFCVALIGLALWLANCEAHDIDQLEAEIRQLTPDTAVVLDVPQIVGSYGLLGIEHILSGIDHLMFVLALVFLFGFKRQLLIAVTGFTLAHSLTLALGALGLVQLPSAPIETWIALSIVMVSAEALSSRDAMTRHFPFVVPLVIGLIHGLGFAGALSAVGLPDAHRAAALLSFNLGVEAGQLGVIGLAWLIARVGRSFAWTRQTRFITLSAFGSISAYWTIERVWALVTA